MKTKFVTDMPMVELAKAARPGTSLAVHLEALGVVVEAVGAEPSGHGYIVARHAVPAILVVRSIQTRGFVPGGHPVEVEYYEAVA